MRDIVRPRKAPSPTWPFFHCLSVEDQVALMKLQWDEFGYHLELPPLPGDIHVDTKMESQEEIGKIIRWAPSRFRGKRG